MRTSILNKFYLILSVFFWLLIWHIVAVNLKQEILLVSPVLVIQKLLELVREATFWETILNSFLKIMSGFTVAMLLGVFLAFLAYKFKFAQILLLPLVSTLKTIPVASFIILLLFWISSDDLSFYTGIIIGMPVFYSNILNGLNSVDHELRDVALVYGATKLQQFRYVYLYQILPHFRSACSIALGLCWKSGAAAEVIGLPSNTIGENLYNAKVYLESDSLFAWTLVIVVVSMSFEFLFMKIIDIFIDDTK